MHTRRTLQPGQRGAKKLAIEYGNRLVCVRYRYDEQCKKRLKTVELIVEESRWDPPANHWQAKSLVQLQVAAAEVTIRQQIKTAGGQWDPQRRVWELRYDRVVALGLEKRIVQAAGC